MKKDMTIQSFFQHEKEHLLADLEKLVAFKSYSEDRACCKEALRFVLSRANEMGFTTKLGRHGDVGVVEFGEVEETIGILVHVDVVGEGPLDLWKSDPFELTIIDDVLYGRGVVDDKGPVISCLYALKYIQEKAVPLKKKIMLIIGTSEEVKWTDMEHYKEEFPLPDYGFSPDGNFPIYNRENGYMDLELIFDEPKLSGEEQFTGGASVNSVPSYASYMKGDQIVEFFGKAAHSSTPEAGVNAINMLCKALAGKEDYRFATFVNKFFPEGFYASKFDFGKEKQLSIIPTMMWQNERKVTINFNVRHQYELSADVIIDEIASYQDTNRFSLRVEERLNPIWVDENLPWLQRMCQITEAHGMDGNPRSGPGCSYAKSMPNFISWGPVFPDDPDCAHMENEQQPVESFLHSGMIYTEYLIEEALV